MKTWRDVLVFSDYFSPGYLAGGPIRSIENLFSSLGDMFHFDLVTRHHDFSVSKAYSIEQINEVRRYTKANLYYASSRFDAVKHFFSITRKKAHSIYFFNSFFSLDFTVLPLLMRRLGWLPKASVLIAPRGELDPGALGLKSTKKRFFIWLVKKIGLYKAVVWQASSLTEAEHIKKIWGSDAPIEVVPNIASFPLANYVCQQKEKGCLRIIFFSRLCKKKNLLFALEVLSRVKKRICFDIYGPIQDQAYWAVCEALIKKMPAMIQVRYRGALFPKDVFATFSQYDLFFLPTLGENFGHVISEALLSRLPVLLSDQTPWSFVSEAKAGWVFPLNQREKFVELIERLCDLSEADYSQLRNNVDQFIQFKRDEMKKAVVLQSNLIEQLIKTKEGLCFR